MKRILFCILLLFSLVIIGCGGGGGSTPPTGPSGPTGQSYSTVSGRIIDQNGNGVEGIKISLGSFTINTNSNGNFTISSVPYNSYTLSGAGGNIGHYIFEPQSIDVNNSIITLSPITAYKALAFGIINKSDEPASSGGTLMKNSGFIHFEWETVSSIERYQIYIVNSDEILVWDSNDHTDFDLLNPKLNLPCDGSIANMPTDDGIYKFRFKITDSTHNVITLPDITVSIGVILKNFPNYKGYSANTLSWYDVPEATNNNIGYKIYINSDRFPTNEFIKSPTNYYFAPIANVAISSGTAYKIQVYAFDTTGWPCEMNYADFTLY